MKTIIFVTILTILAAGFGYVLKSKEQVNCVYGVDIQQAINSGGLTILK